MHVAACANASFMASILRAAGFGGNAELTHRLAGAVGSAGAGRVAAAGHVRRGAHDALKWTACAHAADGRSASVGAPREKTSGSWQLKRRLGRAPCRVMQQDRVLPSSVVPRLSAPFVFELQPCHADLAHLSASSQSLCSLIYECSWSPACSWSPSARPTPALCSAQQQAGGRRQMCRHPVGQHDARHRSPLVLPEKQAFPVLEKLAKEILRRLRLVRCISAQCFGSAVTRAPAATSFSGCDQPPLWGAARTHGGQWSRAIVGLLAF